MDDQVNDGVHQVEDMKKSQLFPFIKVCTMIYCIVIRLKPPHILRMRTVQKFLAPVPRWALRLLGTWYVLWKKIWPIVAQYLWCRQYTKQSPDIIEITFGHKIFFVGNEYPRLSFDLDIHVRGRNDEYWQKQCHKHVDSACNISNWFDKTRAPLHIAKRMEHI